MGLPTPVTAAPSGKLVSVAYDCRAIDGAVRCWQLIQRALWTLDAQPGDKKQKLISDYPILREVWDGYDWQGERSPYVRRFHPTPKDVSNMLPVLSWLMWLRRQNNGNRDYKIILSRAHNVSWWKIAQRFGRCERQVQRWLDGAVAAIYSRHDLEVWGLDLPNV